MNLMQKHVKLLINEQPKTLNEINTFVPNTPSKYIKSIHLLPRFRSCLPLSFERPRGESEPRSFGCP